MFGCDKMKIDSKKIYLVLIGLVGIIGGFFILKYALVYFLPFIIAIIVALLIEPVVHFFEKKTKLSRGLAVGLVLGLILVIFGVFVVAGVSRIYMELERLSHNLPSYQVIWDQFQWILNHNDELKNLMTRWHLSVGQQEAVNKILQDLYEFFTNNFKTIIRELLGLLARLPSLVTVLMISFIATFFISRDRRLLGDLFWRLIPRRFQRKLRSAKNEIIQGAIGFIRAEVILISITTLIAIVGLELLDSNYALIIGFASGLLDLIPVIGPTLIFIPWAIYSMATGHVYYGLALLVLYGVMAVVRQLAEVRLIGKSIGVHPLATMVAMYVGAKALGVVGFFIGPAAVIVLKALTKSGVITIFSAKGE